MNKKDIIHKIINDLPTNECRFEMTDYEWFGWFEEVYDIAFKKGQTLPIDSVSKSACVGCGEDVEDYSKDNNCCTKCWLSV